MDERIGSLAVEKGFLTPAQLDACLQEQERRPGVRIGQILLERRHLDSAQFLDLLREQAARAGMPKQIGRYRVLDILGEGGMGVVYQAVDPELGRKVALKILRGDDPGRIDRFQREAQNAARLRHPNIVTVYESGRDGGALFIAMECIEGLPLSTWTLYRKPAPGDVARIVEQTARAVHAAHEQGIIHRDLKPANIIMDPQDRPHIVDFGLSRAVDSQDVTRTGALIGTPLYMSPEQVRGAKVGPKSDLWSLGAILYEGLSGEPPHMGDSALETYQRIVSEEPKPPKGPPELGAIALKALEKDPDRRYPTALAMAEDLRRWLAHEPVQARPVGRTVRALRAGRKHRAIVIPVAIAALLAVAVVALLLRKAPQPKAPPYDQLVEPRALVEQATYSDVDVTPAIPKLEEILRTAPDLEEAWYLLGRARALLGDDAGAEAALRKAPSLGPARLRLATLLMERSFLLLLGVTEEEQVARRHEAEEVLRDLQLDDGLDREVAAAMLAYVRRDDAEAKRRSRDAIAKFGRRAGVEMLHWILGILTGDLAQIDAALRIRPRFVHAMFARAVFRRDIADYDAVLKLRSLPEAWFNRGNLKHERRDYEGAVADFTETIRLRPDWAMAVYHRGLAYQDWNRPDEALADYETTVRLAPRLARPYVSRGLIRFWKGQDEAALADYTEAISLDPKFAEAWYNRAAVRGRTGDVDGAIADSTRAIELNDQLPEAWGNRGLAYLIQAKYDLAARDLKRALELAPKDWPQRPRLEGLLKKAQNP